MDGFRPTTTTTVTMNDTIFSWRSRILVLDALSSPNLSPISCFINRYQVSLTTSLPPDCFHHHYSITTRQVHCSYILLTYNTSTPSYSHHTCTSILTHHRFSPPLQSFTSCSLTYPRHPNPTLVCIPYAEVKEQPQRSQKKRKSSRIHGNN